jgi:hypothetical protein
MGKSVVGAALAAAAVIGVGHALVAQEAPEGKVGRFQIVHTQYMVFLLDTTTGHVWSRGGVGEWFDEGNPTRRPPREREPLRKGEPRKEGPRPEKIAPTLKLPSKSVDLIVVQRELRAIPGSEGTVRIRLGDVTDGQAFLEVVSDENDLLPRQSVKAGDTVEFALGDKRYVVRVTELRNVLVGDDFAKLLIEEADAPVNPPRKKKGKRKKAETSDPAGKSASDGSPPAKNLKK